MIRFVCVTLTIVLATLAEPAMAYIGPGAGLSLLTAFWALLVAVFSALAFVLWYPIRRVMRRRKVNKPAATQHAEPRSV